MADYISDDDILSAIKGTKSSSGGSNIYSGKSVQIGGYNEPETKPVFSKTQSYGTPAKLLDNTIQVESSGNPYAINRESGAMGIGQFMPDTVAMLHKQGVEFNPFNPVEARAAMDYYISTLSKKHGGDYSKAMAEYGGFKTKDPSQYLSKVLHEVDNTPHDASLIADEQLLNEARALNISPNELIQQQKLTPSRAAGLFARGMAPAVTGATAGQLIAGAPGALVGSMALPAGDILNTGVNAVTGGINKVAGTNIPRLQMPSNMVSQWMTKAGLPVAQSTGERMIESAGSAVGGTGGQVPALANLSRTAISPTARNVAGQLAQAPVAQAISSPLSAAVGQGVSEKTDNPLLGMVAGMVTAAPFGVSLKQRSLNAPSQEELTSAAKNLYAKAEQSGIKFNGTKFADEMFRTGHDLRSEGFTPKAFPGIDSVLNEMVRTDIPKDFTELQSIRRMIQGQQASNDAETRRIASILKDKFDDYVLNAPDNHLTTGSAEGALAWKDARTQYSRLKKAEIFDDMVTNAQFTNQSLSTSLKNQMNTLAKSKRMRLFTADEQKAIQEVAKGSVTQKTLDLISKFAPDTVMGVLSTVGTHALSGNLSAAGLAGATFGAKQIANANKNNSVSKLADMMRLGEVPKFESRLKNVPATALRGLLSGKPTPEGQ
jgi:hypothetical protein